MKNRQFTLVELLIVAAIIGILVTLLLPSLSKAREKAKRAVCASNLKQTGYAALAYANNHNGSLPDWQLPNNFGSPNQTRTVGSSRNLKHNSGSYDAQKVASMGKLIKFGYIDSGAGYKAFFCPSRVPVKRYSEDNVRYGWNKWKISPSTLEYSYQHRYGYLINTLSNKFTFGGDIAIWDGDELDGGTIKSFGTQFAHGKAPFKDQYYNVQRIDLSVLPLYDKNNQLDNSAFPMLYYNNAAAVLNKMQQMLP